MALAASSTTEMSRVHRTSSVTASNCVVMRCARPIAERPGFPGPRSVGGLGGARSPPSIDSHKDAVAQLAVEGLAEMPLALDVLDQDDLPGPDDPGFSVA